MRTRDEILGCVGHGVTHGATTGSVVASEGARGYTENAESSFEFVRDAFLALRRRNAPRGTRSAREKEREGERGGKEGVDGSRREVGNWVRATGGR